VNVITPALPNSYEYQEKVEFALGLWFNQYSGCINVASLYMQNLPKYLDHSRGVHVIGVGTTISHRI